MKWILVLWLAFNTEHIPDPRGSLQVIEFTALDPKVNAAACERVLSEIVAKSKQSVNGVCVAKTAI